MPARSRNTEQHSFNENSFYKRKLVDITVIVKLDYISTTNVCLLSHNLMIWKNYVHICE